MEGSGQYLIKGRRPPLDNDHQSQAGRTWDVSCNNMLLEGDSRPRCCQTTVIRSAACCYLDRTNWHARERYMLTRGNLQHQLAGDDHQTIRQKWEDLDQAALIQACGKITLHSTDVSTGERVCVKGNWMSIKVVVLKG